MATSNPAADTSAFEETANRIRELNEKLIQLANPAGQGIRSELPLIRTRRPCRASNITAIAVSGSGH